jgi:hypothetical protein
MEYVDYLARLQTTHPDLVGKIERFTSLEHILNWLPGEGVNLATLEMVTQDEYCHDLFLPMPNSTDWLFFSMT